VLSRRQFGIAAAAALAAGQGRAATPAPPTAERLGMTLTRAHLAAGRDFVRAHPTVDVHSHPGRFFMRGASTPLAKANGAPFPEAAIARMRDGGVGAVVFAAVADFPVLEATPQGLGALRPDRVGEAYEDYRRQMQVLRRLRRRGGPPLALTPADIVRAHAMRRTAGVVAVEGGDFIEDRMDRIAEAHREGVRSICIIHYQTNRIGDPQTNPRVHGGLTPLGRDVVREMNRTGMIVDLAHASFEATQQAVAVSSKPMMISHSNIRRPGLDHPRLVSLDHARVVTQAGGLIGALPAGAGETRFVDYVDTIFRAVDDLGIDHVGVGTDMDFTFKAVVDDYRDWPLVPAALLARGMHAPEVAKVMGGNFLRLFAAVQA
jgi:membrane dipeptidase